MNPRVYPLDDTQYKFQIPIVSRGKKKTQFHDNKIVIYVN